jgi:hypothetical protein
MPRSRGRGRVEKLVLLTLLWGGSLSASGVAGVSSSHPLANGEGTGEAAWDTALSGIFVVSLLVAGLFSGWPEDPVREP